MNKRFFAMLVATMTLCGCAAPDSVPVSVPNVQVQQSTSASSEATSSATSATTATAATTTPATTTTTAPEPVSEPEPVPEFTSVDILCAGDNLIHSNIYNQAAARAGGNGYDFSYPYQYVAPYIEEADLAILNQETIVTDAFPPSNYPCFCTPEALGDEMIELGFDAISISNNHCLDQGEAGLLATLEYWRTNHPDIPVYGAYENRKDMNNIRHTTVNDISFAFLGYMEHTNGLYLPKNSECELVYLSELETIEKQIKAAAKKYDCVIVSVHFGLEISNTITEQQYTLAQKFADWGADIIVGTQPHTIQSMEYLERADGGQSFVFYCLGNLISSQYVQRSMVEMLGRITVTKNLMTGEIELSDANAVPLVNHYDAGSKNVRIYPYKDYTAELAAQHGCEGGLTMEYIQYLIDNNIPKEFLSY